MQKIMYFTAGAVATETELEEIDALNTLAEAPYSVVVRRGDGVGSPNYGAGIEDTDYAAGTIPEAYEDFPVFDPDNPPNGLPDNQAIVEDGQVIEGYVITVVDGVVTAITAE